MKSKKSFDKLRGGYYTPQAITEFICKWIINKNTKNILEPSCGDGNFLKAIVERQEKLNLNLDITGVELCLDEAKKAMRYGTNVECQDFFAFYRDKVTGKSNYDAIVGNPPFIRYQDFDEKSRDIAFFYMKENGFHPTKLTNIWLPFLILSCLALSENGRLGMVIPAELFQVNYAGETREFLARYFDRLTLITFQKLVFEEIQQEVILLLGEKKSEDKGIQVIELSDLDDLKELDLNNFYNYEIKELNHSTEKWIKYYLTNKEIKLIRQLRECEKIPFTTELFEINVGLVSGENAFFLLNRNTVDEYQLANSTRMVIGRTEQLKGVILSERDFKTLIENGKKVYMFMPKNLPFSELSKAEQEYINYGVEQGYNKGYKCRIRKNWYCVPQSCEPDAFILRQVNRYPRIILNHVNAVSTDTIHKVRFLDGVNPEFVAAAFLNSFTLALAEITGRSYGGGVLTFEPGEIRQLKIPMKNAEKLDVNKIDKLIRDDRIDEVLDYTDQILLIEGLGLTKYDVETLRNIWIKLSERRIGRKEKRGNQRTLRYPIIWKPACSDSLKINQKKWKKIDSKKSSQDYDKSRSSKKNNAKRNP